MQTTGNGSPAQELGWELTTHQKEDHKMFDLRENGQTCADWTHFVQDRRFCEHDNEPSGFKGGEKKSFSAS